MPKTKKSEKHSRCPKCGGAEFEHPVGAKDVHIVRNGKLRYMYTILSDESADDIRCAKCGALAPDSLLETLQPRDKIIIKHDAPDPAEVARMADYLARM